MSRPIVKICGITRFEDGHCALESGADWLGFIRWPKSPRFRPLEECADLIRSLRSEMPRPFQAVGVFVDAPSADIEHEIGVAGFDRVQLHGSEPMELIQTLAVPAIKTIKIRDASSIALAENYPGVDLLTDTDDPVLPGGTGRRYDPALLRDLVARRRVIVAGGLNPANVGAVVKFLNPFGVDVSSGVESSPGIKDHDKIRAFTTAVEEAVAQEAPKETR